MTIVNNIRNLLYRLRVVFILILLPLLVYAATFTISTTGNWSNTGTWSGGALPGTTDDVAMNNSRSVTLQSGDDHTVISLTGGNTNTININTGSKLTLNNPGGTALTTSNATVINVDGTLIIIGDVVINNNLTLNVTGSLIITGDVVLKNGAALTVPAGGGVSIDGDLSGGNGTTVDVGGSLDVTGDIGLNNPSTINVTGGGTVTAGSCSGVACGSVMPVELLFFKATVDDEHVKLSWATASEENFDYFSLERSANGVDFKEVAQIQGMGDSFERVDYEFTDEFPLQGRSYYRLRSIDFDGYTEIFDYVMVEVEGVGNDFSIYPNPIQNSQFSLQTNFTDEAQLIIYNNVGKIEENLIINDWMSGYNINLQSGSYLFKVITSDGVIVNRVLVK